MSLYNTQLFSQNMPNQQSTYPEQKISIQPDSIQLNGTFLRPNMKSVPLVVFVQGSGPTDRDGNNIYMTNNSLKYLAHRLYDHGIATLRFDKRGIAESGSGQVDESKVVFEDSSKDVQSWLEFCKQMGSFSSITILGHSEGALHAILTAQNYKVDKLIAVAGPGYPLGKIINTQLQMQPDTLRKVAAVIIDSLEAGHEVKQINPMLLSLFRPSVQPFLRSWMKYNPTDEIAKLDIPVLIVQGDNDIQVSVDNAELLHKASSKSQLVIVTDMNHVLKLTGRDISQNMSSYSDPVAPVATQLVNSIVDFIKVK